MLNELWTAAPTAAPAGSGPVQVAPERRSAAGRYARSDLGMATALGRTEAYSLLSLSLACFGILVNTFQGDGEPLIASIALSGLAFAFCYALIRWLGNAFMRRGFKGKDLCKLKQTEMYAKIPNPKSKPRFTRSTRAHMTA